MKRRYVATMILSALAVVCLLAALSGCATGNATVADSSANDRGTVSDASDALAYHPLPDSYRMLANAGGTVERVDYKTADADGSGRVVDKHAYVYLPAGYDAADSATRYDVLYLLHGAGGAAEDFLGGTDQTSTLKTMLDNMIANGDIEPMIVVTPTYYQDDGGSDNDQTAAFPAELVSDLMPAVEGTYRTYAQSTDRAGFVASRGHRAFSGYSLGAVETWYAFIDCLDCFQTFIPMSCDCWAVEEWGGAKDPEQTAQILADAACASGYAPDGYDIYVAAGTDERADRFLTPQIEAMEEHADVFVSGNTVAQGNLHYVIATGASHSYEYGYDYLYDALPLYFPAQ